MADKDTKIRPGRRTSTSSTINSSNSRRSSTRAASASSKVVDIAGQEEAPYFANRLRDATISRPMLSVEGNGNTSGNSKDIWLSIPLDSSSEGCRRLAALPVRTPLRDQGLVLMWLGSYFVGPTFYYNGHYHRAIEAQASRWQITEVLQMFDEVEPGIPSTKRKVLRLANRSVTETFKTPKQTLSLPGCHSALSSASLIVRGGRWKFQPKKNAARPMLVNENPRPGYRDCPDLEFMY